MRPTSSDCHLRSSSLPFALRFAGVVKNFELRLEDLEAMPVAVAGLDFAVERDQHAGSKFVFQICCVEPDALQGVAALADSHLEDGHAARAKEAEGAYFGDNAGHLPRAQLADAARIQAIFIAKRQVVEQVFDCAEAFFQQDLGKSRADAFDVLDIGGEFEHWDDGK